VIRETLLWLFAEYERQKVPYCVLRNYGGLPDTIGRDVDILIHPDKLAENYRIMGELCRRFGWLIFKRVRIDFYEGYRLFRNASSDEFLLFDFHTALEENGGIVYLPGDLALQGRVYHRGFYILDPATEALHLLMHSVFGTGPVRTKYCSLIIQRIRQNPDRFELLLREVLGSDLAEAISALLQKGNVEAVIEMRGKIMKKLMQRPRVLLMAIIYRIHVRLAQIKGLFRPQGIFVVLIGPDGVGKSTCAAEVERILSKAIRIMHWHLGFRPTILPARDRLAIKGNLLLMPGTQKTGNKASTRKGIRGIVRLIYHSLDYLLGYYLKIWPEMARGGIVLAERYFFDYYVHPERKGIDLPNWITRLILWLMPKPDLTILLYEQPEIIYQRRQELSVAEIQRQLALYETVGKRLKQFVKVSTRGSVQETSREVVNHIIDCLVTKIGKM